MVEQPKNKAVARVSLRLQLKAFVQTVRGIARLTMEEGDAELFKANPAKKPRLRGLGISSHVPTIRCQVDINEETRTKIASHILKSQARRGQRQVQEILEKKTDIPLQKYVLANKTAWSESVRPCSDTMKKRKANKEERDKQLRDQSEIEAEDKHVPETEESKTVKTSHDSPPTKEAIKIKICFYCAKCNNEIPSDRKAFRRDTLDAKTWCGICKKNYMAKSYTCQCGELWYKCGMHKRVNDAMKGDAAIDLNTLPAKEFRKTVKKRRPLMNQLEDLEGHFKITKKRRCEKINRACEAPLRASMLSAGLKRKFAYLCQNGEE